MSETKPAKGRTHWPMKDATTHFSELVRAALKNGPQRVTVRGKDAVVVIDAAEFDRREKPNSGQEVWDALANSPHKDVEFKRRSVRVRVRDVDL